VNRTFPEFVRVRKFPVPFPFVPPEVIDNKGEAGYNLGTDSRRHPYRYALYRT
jgi:hypothetical protein